MSGVKGLENCNEALKKGLITQADYDAAKSAFLRVEQLTHAFSAGLLADSEMSKAKEAFLTAVGGPTSAGGVAEVDLPEAEEDDELAALPLKPVAPSPGRPKAVSEPPKPQMPKSPKSSTPKASNGDAGGVFKPAREGAHSISGIQVSQKAVDTFEEMKHSRKYRYIVFDIDYTAGLVVLKETGAYDSEYDEFTECLPDADCRFAIYDYDYTNDDGLKFNKFVFVMWSPDISPLKTKMMYASTKEYFRDCLDGTGIEVQATDISEIDADSMYDRVRASMTRK